MENPEGSWLLVSELRKANVNGMGSHVNHGSV